MPDITFISPQGMAKDTGYFISLFDKQNDNKQQPKAD